VRQRDEMTENHAFDHRLGRALARRGPKAVRRTRRGRFSVVVLAAAMVFETGVAAGQLSTADHLAESGFWPTQDQPSRGEFAGPEACARCHALKTAAQEQTPMARNLMPAAAAEILHSQPALTFSVGNFKYRIDTGASQAMYSVANGGQGLSYPLTWAFGTGRVAQSYLFKKEDGGFYEARTTYFTSLKSLDFTPSRDLLSPSGVEEAMYRPVGPDEVQRCFACHATASTIAGRFDEKHLIPGVTCEACHGPAAIHIKSMDNRAPNETGNAKSAIFNPGDLLAADAVDFCGACHGTWWDTKLSGVKGVSTARSAPYRLVTSKCWGTGDARLACTSCHDPHRQLQTDASDYDPICLSCHVSKPGEKLTSSHPGAACPKATKKCTDCHMEKVQVPEMRANFTDHRIRIPHPGEPFPE
jgi:hypothetical protein